MGAIALQPCYFPGLHSLCRIRPNEVNRKMRRFCGCKPSVVVLWFQYQGASVVKRFQNFIRVSGNDAEALKNEFVLVFVLPLPSVPDPSKSKQLISHKRNRPRFAPLLLHLFFG